MLAQAGTAGDAQTKLDQLNNVGIAVSDKGDPYTLSPQERQWIEGGGESGSGSSYIRWPSRGDWHGIRYNPSSCISWLRYIRGLGGLRISWLRYNFVMGLCVLESSRSLARPRLRQLAQPWMLPLWQL